MGLTLIFPENGINCNRKMTRQWTLLSIKKAPPTGADLQQGNDALGFVREELERHACACGRGQSCVGWELSLHDCLSLSNL